MALKQKRTLELFKHRFGFEWLAFFFLILQFFVLLGNLPSPRYDVFFWFCNHTPLIFAFAFAFLKINLIKGLICVGFLPQFIWTLDFLLRLFFDYNFFRITAYVFENSLGYWVLLPIGIHMFSTNLALLATYKFPTKNKVLTKAALYIALLYVTTIILTLPERNVNWLQGIGKEGFLISFTGYQLVWPFFVFFVLVLPTYFFQKYLYEHYEQNKLKKRTKN